VAEVVAHEGREVYAVARPGYDAGQAGHPERDPGLRGQGGSAGRADTVQADAGTGV